eukprot:15437777-Heterocapsa_arctica.AAC.1
MPFLAESGGGLRDRGAQGRHYRDHWKMDTDEVMDSGGYEGKDKVYCTTAGNETLREKEIRNIRGNDNVKDKGTEHCQIQEAGLQFLCGAGGQQNHLCGRCGRGHDTDIIPECGNDHYASYFYQIKRQMDDNRGMKEVILDIISVRTKAAIIESILGLGYIYKNNGYEELKDMPDIINEMETDLRDFKPENFKHKNRGQHPDTVEGREDNNIMGDTDAFMDDISVEDLMEA